MLPVRVIGILLALIGMLFFLIGLISGNSGAQSDALTVALFAMVAGLIIAFGAAAGARLEQRAKDAKAKASKPPAPGGKADAGKPDAAKPSPAKPSPAKPDAAKAQKK